MELISGGIGPVISSGANNVRQFKMRACAKAFDAQIAGLYSDKIKAVIRELSTNAYEAHQLLKIEDKPFNVKLPSTYDPILKIRDFGPGISDEDIGDIYITLYESTKEHSNEFGGAFGLGSKSPYAYTGNFSVTSIHNGTKTIYALSRDNVGIPCISTLMSCSTTEPSGIEIEIPVDKYDISRFIAAAQSVYKWFKTKPNITGNNTYTHLDTGNTVLSGTNWRLTDSNEPCVAVMGNIAYPLNGYTGPNSEIIHKRGLVLDFKIGEIEPTPSRESLSFNVETLDAISRRFSTIITEYSTIVQTSIDKETSYWNAVIKNEELSRTSIFTYQVKWKGRDVNSRISLLKDPKDYTTNMVPSLRKVDTWYKSKKEGYVNSITPGLTTKILVNDAPSYSKMRIKAYKESTSSPTYILDETDLVEFKKHVDCDASYYVVVSDLPKPVINRNTSSKKSKVLKYNPFGGYNNTCWDAVEIDDTTEGYYLNIKNNKIVIDGKEYSPVTFSSLYNIIKLKEGKDIVLYGIKPKGSSEELEPMVDLIEKYFNSIKDDNEKYCLAIKAWDSVSAVNYRFLSFLDNKELDNSKNQDLLNLRKEFLRIKEDRKIGVNSDVISYINQIFPNKKYISSVSNVYTLTQDVTNFLKKYPLMGHITYYSISPELLEELEFYFLGRNK